MNEFVQRHASSVIGFLSGFDRLLFRGTLRRIASASGLSSFLGYTGVLHKDFAEHSMRLTEQVKEASLAVAQKAGRPVQYLSDPSVRKEDLAREIARRDKIDSGLVCLFTAVEPCWSFEIHRNRAAKKLELHSRQRRCLHLYHYLIHPQLGFMHIRLQSWFPFTAGVCINGREWLSRQMDGAVRPAERLPHRALLVGAAERVGKRCDVQKPRASGDAVSAFDPPGDRDDAQLLQAVARGEFAINGLRNRDIRALLYPDATPGQIKNGAEQTKARRQSAAVGRKLAMLRIHGIIRKVPRTHRYQVTDKGRLIITAVLAAAAANATTLAKAA